MTVDEYRTPKLLCVDGRPVITIGRVPPCRELPPDFTATALGWSRTSCLVATCPDKPTLINHCRNRFPDCRIDDLTEGRQ